MTWLDDKGLRLYTGNGHNFADRFSRIVDADASLLLESCYIDGSTIYAT